MKNNNTNEVEMEQLKETIDRLKQQVSQYEVIIGNLNRIITELGNEVGKKQVEVTCLNLELDSARNQQNI